MNTIFLYSNNAGYVPFMLIPSILVNKHYDDRYFDVVNAIHEAKQIFFKGAKILEKLAVQDELIIGETGFGSGRMLLAFLDYLKSNSITNKRIIWNSVELHPLSPEQLQLILNCFNETHSDLITLITRHYQSLRIYRNGWYTCTINTGFCSLILRLRIGEALEMVTELDKPCDAWFLDGHGPKKNPQMWRDELLCAIAAKTNSNGTFATYTVAGIVKRGLKNAGFTISIMPGCGGKKESLCGWK
jgi:tRNA U34 5-methylaminomethyl-2-thiouridine-forming methyltransferase MnmC